MRVVRQAWLLTFGELARLLDVPSQTVFLWLTYEPLPTTPELLALMACAERVKAGARPPSPTELTRLVRAARQGALPARG